MKENELIVLILAFFLPPLAVYMINDNNERQSKRTLIACVLWVLVWVPAVVYALDLLWDKKWFYPTLDNLVK